MNGELGQRVRSQRSRDAPASTAAVVSETCVRSEAAQLGAGDGDELLEIQDES